MVRISVPSRFVGIIRLISPCCPPFSLASRKQFEKGSVAACLNEIVLLIWLARMFALPTRQVVDLSATRLQGSGVFPAYAKQDQLGDVSEIKPHTSSVRTAVLSDLVPHEVAFVVEAPRLHYRQSFGK